MTKSTIALGDKLQRYLIEHTLREPQVLARLRQVLLGLRVRVVMRPAGPKRVLIQLQPFLLHPAKDHRPQLAAVRASGDNTRSQTHLTPPCQAPEHHGRRRSPRVPDVPHTASNYAQQGGHLGQIQ